MAEALPPRLLTPAEVSEYLGCSVDTLRRWRAEMTGPPSIKLSRRCVRYDAAALRAWLAEQGGRQSVPA